ncbi:ester cyclase [Streptomyces sp. BE303]|uniref:ester cyclase n=1 Tax=Streptomyces sp. BE303 TaxID=3002528 RepID=UPI002E79901D|nr:nuclear transport factor 2 family protein [Streptomyces sp. BE303]MED7948803.1 nuclear transport factor 2 family protein [Streptomyces sp. BE303]
MTKNRQTDARSSTTRLFEAFNNHLEDLEETVDSYAEDDVLEEHASGARLQGRPELREYLEGWYKASPDTHCELHRIIIEGDAVAVTFTASGTPQQDFPGYIALPENRTDPIEYSVEYMALFELAPDGLILRETDYANPDEFTAETGERAAA